MKEHRRIRRDYWDDLIKQGGIPTRPQKGINMNAIPTGKSKENQIIASENHGDNEPDKQGIFNRSSKTLVDLDPFKNRSKLFKRMLVVLNTDRRQIEEHEEVKRLTGLNDETFDPKGKIPPKPKDVKGIIDSVPNVEQRAYIKRVVNDSVLSPRQQAEDIIFDLIEVNETKKRLNKVQVLGGGVSRFGFGGKDSSALSSKGWLMFKQGSVVEEMTESTVVADDVISYEEIVEGGIKISTEKGFFKRFTGKEDPIGTIKVTRKSSGEEYTLAGVKNPGRTVRQIVRTAKIIVSEKELIDRFKILNREHPELFEGLLENK